MEAYRRAFKNGLAEYGVSEDAFRHSSIRFRSCPNPKTSTAMSIGESDSPIDTFMVAMMSPPGEISLSTKAPLPPPKPAEAIPCS